MKKKLLLPSDRYHCWPAYSTKQTKLRISGATRVERASKTEGEMSHMMRTYFILFDKILEFETVETSQTLFNEI